MVLGNCVFNYFRTLNYTMFRGVEQMHSALTLTYCRDEHR